jgi:DNA-binding NtrC family response regulator
MNKQNMKQKILIVDDQADVRLSASFLLENHGFQVVEANSPSAALEHLKAETIELVLMDMNYTADTTSGEEGLKLIQDIQQVDSQIAIIVMTAWSSVELAVEAMRNGANNFVEKPWDNQRLVNTIKQALKVQNLERQNRSLKNLNSALQQQNAELQPTQELLFQSASMKLLLSQVERLAKTDATILLTGENGTGKSSIARYIHSLSSRRENILVSVNMGAIPESLFESEMFGHKKGAFTDAKEDRVGRFQLAESGSLFLDEIANIPISQQAKLLRVLEDNEFEMVGSSRTQSTNVRLICATNANIQKHIDNGKFRADLYFRLNTIEIQIPALRHRVQDIIPLATHFLEKHGIRYNRSSLTLSKQAQSKLLRHDWPGNVRELSHIIERAVLLTEHDEILAEDIFFKQTTEQVTVSPSHKHSSSIPLMPLEQAEFLLLTKALTEANGNTIEAAKVLGLSQSAMYRRLEKHGINKSKLG